MANENIDKSRYLEGLIETTLIPGKLEEFVTQVSPIKLEEVASIYGDNKLTGMLKDVIKESDMPSKMAKAKLLKNAVKISSVLYSDDGMNDSSDLESFGESGYAEDPSKSGLPNNVDKITANTKHDPVSYSGKTDPSALLYEIVNKSQHLIDQVTELKHISKPAPTEYHNKKGKKTYTANFADENFASGARPQVEQGPSVSSIPASVPADSDHVTIFAEDVQEGDVLNGRKVVAITQEINPVDGSNLFSIELDDRNIVRACEGTPITFSIEDLMMNDNFGDANMNEYNVTYSEALAAEDFSHGIRTTSDNYASIVDYHDLDENFDAEEYFSAMDYLENEEMSDPVNQLNNKIDALNEKFDSFSEMVGDANEPVPVTYGERVQYIADILSGMDSCQFSDSGCIFAKKDGVTLIFSEDDEAIYTPDADGNFNYVASYDDLFDL